MRIQCLRCYEGHSLLVEVAEVHMSLTMKIGSTGESDSQEEATLAVPGGF